MASRWKKIGMATIVTLTTFTGITAYAADDASMPNVVQAIRETDNLLGMVRGMLSMVEGEIARARGRAGASVKDLEDEKKTAQEMIDNLTKERARLQAIVDAWGQAFDANMKIGIKEGELADVRNRLPGWERSPWYVRGDLARMKAEIEKLEKEIPAMKKAAHDAQKKFDDLMKKNLAKEAATDQLRAGTDAWKRDLEKFPDPEFWEMRLDGRMVPSNQRFGARFMLQPPPQGPHSPELTPRIDWRFPATIPFRSSLSAQPAYPATIPFPTIIPFRPYANPIILPFQSTPIPAPHIIPFPLR